MGLAAGELVVADVGLLGEADALQHRVGPLGVEAISAHGFFADELADRETLAQAIGHTKRLVTAIGADLGAVFDQSGEQSASVFYTAYVLKNGAKNRPLTFVFNGGPGAASAFLHLGLVGPRVLDFGPDGRDAAMAGDGRGLSPA